MARNGLLADCSTVKPRFLIGFTKLAQGQLEISICIDRAGQILCMQVQSLTLSAKDPWVESGVTDLCLRPGRVVVDLSVADLDGPSGLEQCKVTSYVLCAR